jgi:hypothetical protein
MGILRCPLDLLSILISFIIAWLPLSLIMPLNFLSNGYCGFFLFIIIIIMIGLCLLSHLTYNTKKNMTKEIINFYFWKEKNNI